MNKHDLDYKEYIEIAEGVYWVGFYDEKSNLHCNPYLIVDGDEAVLIDSGSRDDFSTVMLKIMRTGITPNKIKRLIYQHYDPDLCGNIPHIEAIINSDELKIISQHANNVFIDYYSVSSPKLCIERDLDYKFEFASGRRLEFIMTPYAHAPGSFVTYDTKTKTLFSSDLFGNYDYSSDLYSLIGEICGNCSMPRTCPITQGKCSIKGLLRFHRENMPSKKALLYAIERIEEKDIAMIAPQHGNILDTAVSREIAIDRLKEIDCVGIDYFLQKQRREEVDE